MIKKEYFKDAENAFQTLAAVIQADRPTVFRYLSTSEGISSWFPQLSLSKENNQSFIQFDMGDGTFEKMMLLDFTTDKQITYEWATGKITFELEEVENGTKLTFHETLPLNFEAIPQDFTGWFVQMKNIQSVLETGSAAELEPTEIKEIREQVKQEL